MTVSGKLVAKQRHHMVDSPNCKSWQYRGNECLVGDLHPLSVHIDNKVVSGVLDIGNSSSLV